MITILVGVFAIFLVSLATAYCAAKYNNGYWKRRGVAGPQPVPFSGNMDEWFGKMPLVFKLRKWTKEYGKVYGIQEGCTNVMITSDVNILNELFSKKFEYFHGRKLAPFTENVDTAPRVNVFGARGPRWKRLRAIANSAFTVNNLKKIMPIMSDSTRVMLNYLEETIQVGKPININDHFHELSMDVIMRVALGQRESRQFRNVEHVKTFTNLFASFGTTRFHYYGYVVPPPLRILIFYAVRAYGRLARGPFLKIMNFVQAEVKQRKENRANRGEIETDKTAHVDFIDLLLDAECDSSAIAKIYNEKTFDKVAVKVSKKLTEDEIASQCLVFLLAGFDTTANSLSVTCHFLARNMEAQERLRNEIFEICGEDEPSYEQLNQLRYADAVMKEALRLCPIGAAVCARVCAKTTTLGDYTIDEGTIVQADVFSLQQDKTLWGDDAHEFRPERWLEEGAQMRATLQWMPFGAGPRICIGMRLAYLEEKMALVAILRKYAIRKSPESEKEMELLGDSVLNPKSVTVALEKLER